ncbi:Band 4.1-like protein 4A [Lamellibrachia satsuma]|nr:Band 4.1-like protein 4A [Lamellibrachia satsuma]
MLVLSRILPRLFKSDTQKSANTDTETSSRRWDKSKSKSKYFICRILLLDDTQLTLNVKASSKGQVLQQKVFDHLNLLEKEYFGLRFLDQSNQTHWLDPSKSLSSQLKTAPPHTFYFGVKFYAVDPCKLREEITRYQFFLQVKRDILQGRLPVPFDLAAELCAYAVQSELGDYDLTRHTYGYVSELRFLPNQTEDLELRIMQIHKALLGQVPSMTEYKYLDRVKWLEMYGVDLHPVKGEGNVEYFLGLTPTGIVVYRNKSKVSSYFWPRITKLHFKVKMFMVKVRDKNNSENVYAFECMSKEAGKHLWKCCVEHHAFFRLTAANESYSATEKLFRFGSKYRYSGRTPEKKQPPTKPSKRPSPRVVRVPSKRYQRRASVGGPPAPENLVPIEIYTAEPAQTHRHRDGYQSAPEAPWEGRNQKKGGLYTTGRDSPMSLHSERMLFPRRPQSGSENESTYHRRRGGAAESGNESEVSHRQRRHRRSEESLTYTESQWKEMHMRVRGGNYSGPFQLRANGSLSSMASEASHAQQRRRRRRSRSPGKKPPEELAQHFKYVDPEAEGMTQDQLRDIAYTTVETNVQPFRSKSPHARHRHRSPKRRSCGDIPEQPTVAPPAPPPDPILQPEGEAPPPYTSFIEEPPSQPPVGHSPAHGRVAYRPGHQGPNTHYRPAHEGPNTHYRQSYEGPNTYYRPVVSNANTLQTPVFIQRNETHAAPIVKTKPQEVVSNTPVCVPYVNGRVCRPSNGVPSDSQPWTFVPSEDHMREDSGVGIEQESLPSSSSPGYSSQTLVAPGVKVASSAYHPMQMSHHAVRSPGQMSSPVKPVAMPSPAHWNIPPSRTYNDTAYANSPRSQSSSGHGAGGHGAGGHSRRRDLMTQL